MYSSGDYENFEEFKKLPTSNGIPRKVTLHSYTHNELVLGTGESVGLFTPHMSCYSDHQVMFSTGKWGASLFPWNEDLEKRCRAAAANSERTPRLPTASDEVGK